MFVRWKRVRRKHQTLYEWVPGADPGEGGSYRCRQEERWLRVATLVESRRVDRKSWQRTHYLCSIREDRVTAPIAAGHMWDELERKLAALDLPSETRAKVEASVQDAVPRPDPAAISRAWAAVFSDTPA